MAFTKKSLDEWATFFEDARNDKLAVLSPFGRTKMTIQESIKVDKNGREAWAKVAKKHKGWLKKVKSLHLLGVAIHANNFADHFPMNDNWTEADYHLAWVGLYNVYRKLVEKGLD